MLTMQGQELDGTFEAASSHAPLQCDHPPLQVNGVADEATLCDSHFPSSVLQPFSLEFLELRMCTVAKTLCPVCDKCPMIARIKAFLDPPSSMPSIRSKTRRAFHAQGFERPQSESLCLARSGF